MNKYLLTYKQNSIEKIKVEKELRIKQYGDMVRDRFPKIFEDVSNYDLLEITEFFKKQNPPKRNNNGK